MGGSVNFRVAAIITGLSFVVTGLIVEIKAFFCVLGRLINLIFFDEYAFLIGIMMIKQWSEKHF